VLGELKKEAEEEEKSKRTPHLELVRLFPFSRLFCATQSEKTLTAESSSFLIVFIFLFVV
jgi:hypothetical protein